MIDYIGIKRVDKIHICKQQEYNIHFGVLVTPAEKVMPIYEYRCDACDHHFEKMQKISDKPITRCPECQADAAQKLISASRFKLTGSGWYETDFKQKSTSQPTQQKSTDEASKAGDAKSSTASSDNSKTTDSKE